MGGEKKVYCRLRLSVLMQLGCVQGCENVKQFASSFWQENRQHIVAHHSLEIMQSGSAAYVYMCLTFIFVESSSHVPGRADDGYGSDHRGHHVCRGGLVPVTGFRCIYTPLLHALT